MILIVATAEEEASDEEEVKLNVTAKLEVTT